MSGIIQINNQPASKRVQVKLQLIFEEDLKKNSPILKNFQEKIKREDFKAKENEQLIIENQEGFQLLVFIGAGKQKEFNLIKYKNFLADGFRIVTSRKFSEVVLIHHFVCNKDYFNLGKVINLALDLSNYRFLKHKNKKFQEKDIIIKQLNYYYEGINSKDQKTLEQGIEAGQLISTGVNLTRDLVNEPASHQHPDDMVDQANIIAKESDGKITIEVLNEQECKKLAMGAFLAVAKGSDRPAKFIILKYFPQRHSGKRVVASASRINVDSGQVFRQAQDTEQSRSARMTDKSKTICLIGKSIIFDSGGLSLKPSDSMMDMKIDMAGGATVLGIFKALSKLDNIKHIIYGILPVCENMPSGKAMRPGDIATAMNGKTIEILNTDAEGRLTLADALSYAEKKLAPDLIIDLATLTGACMVALGKEITGMLGNQEVGLKLLENSTKNTGEQLWRLPMYKRYLKKMTNGIADLKNVGGGRWGGTITAALFLNEFVEKTTWVHLDIAGSAYNDENSYAVISKGGTGWGVETLVELIKNY